MNFPVFDLHCDTALRLLGDDVNQAGSLNANGGHIDLTRAKQLSGYCQCFACFTTPYMEKKDWYGLSPVVVFEREIATIQREIDKNKRKIGLVYSADDIRANYEKGKMSALLTIEGPAGFDFDPELLESMFQAGFRISTLGWNESNVLTGSNQTGEGLTDLGREYVRNAQELGILVDVSHISDAGFWDIMKITQAPVIASHSNSRAVCPHARNLTDDMFRAIRDSGGVPHCACGGLIKPDVVLYEEGLDEKTIKGAVRAIAEADVLIVGGTSLTVYPAAGLIRYYGGNRLVLINRDETPYDGYANLIFREPIGQVLGQCVNGESL